MTAPRTFFSVTPVFARLAWPVRRGFVAAAAVLATAAALAAAPPGVADYNDIQQLVRQGDTPAALRRVEQRIAQNPKDPQLQFLKGVLQSDAGQHDAAEQTFLDLTRLYPELPEPYNNLAALYARSNRYDKAREALERAVQLNPGYGVAQENLGDVYARLAAESYAKASRLDGASPRLAPKLAQIRELLRAPPAAQ